MNNICQKNATASTRFCNIWCWHLCSSKISLSWCNPRWKCLIHHQAANLDGWWLSALIQNKGIHLIKHHQIQVLYWKSQSWFFFFKKTHFYYAQVQGKLALTGLPWCDPWIHLSDGNEMCVNRINFDSEYWENELLPKLKNFFFNYALSFIVGQAKRAQSR